MGLETPLFDRFQRGAGQHWRTTDHVQA
jgi:hypothetical protein